jgi:TNF receptor-associated factor 6
MLMSSGHYVWKVSEISKQLKSMEGASPTLKVLYSPGFYTSPFGYKFCARLNVSPGNGQFLSLLVHLMKGDYDMALDWPFAGIISLMAVNQNGRRHLAETMEARSELAAFQRPARDINPRGFGYSEFIRVQDLTTLGFLKDDMLIIRIQVRANPAMV